MDDFSFRGKPISLFGAAAAFGESMRIGARIERSEYAMPGGGTIEIGAAAYKPTTRSVSITPQDGKAATPAWRRAILAWLQGGRGELIMADDPDVYRIAQFDTDGTYDWRTWPTGMLQLTMTLQPHAFSRHMTRADGQTTDGLCELQLVMATQIPAPVTVEAEAVGGTMTALEIACGDQAVRLDGLTVAAGETIVYRAGDPFEADTAVIIGGKLTFAHVTRWAQLTAAGATTLHIRTTGSEAKISAAARCRWPA